MTHKIIFNLVNKYIYLYINIQPHKNYRNNPVAKDS